MKARHSLFIILLALLLLPISQVHAQQPMTLAQLKTRIGTIRAADQQQANKLADDLRNELAQAKRIPFVENEDVLFLSWNTAAVKWIGDFSNWKVDDAIVGDRVGSADLWVASAQFPINGRVEYKVIFGENQPVLDENNPDANLTADNSQLRMPLYVVTDVTTRTASNKGKVSAEQLIESKMLKYTLGYWVYTPYGYDDMKDLPVLYALDGNDFLDEHKGRLISALDYLIEQEQISPVIAVLVDARDPGNAGINRRETEFIENQDYARFIAEELVPAIDAAYHTKASPQARLITGVSYGGLASAYIGGLYPTVFQMVAPFSPSLWASKQSRAIYEKAETLPARYFIGVGYPKWDNFITQDILDLLAQKHSNVVYMCSIEGHNWGNWRGMLDEMLEYFWGTSLIGQAG